MSYFLQKTEQTCLNEIKAASEFVSQTFKAPINLERLKDQIDLLIEEKIARYYHERFKDWTVADLILLSQTVAKHQDAEDKLERRTRKQTA